MIPLRRGTKSAIFVKWRCLSHSLPSSLGILLVIACVEVTPSLGDRQERVSLVFDEGALREHAVSLVPGDKVDDAGHVVAT